MSSIVSETPPAFFFALFSPNLRISQYPESGLVNDLRTRERPQGSNCATEGARRWLICQVSLIACASKAPWRRINISQGSEIRVYAAKINTAPLRNAEN